MARYKPSDPRDYIEILEFLNRAKEKDAEVELSLVYKKRTNPQNRYIHFMCAYFAHCYGCSLVEAKEIYLKKYACREIFLVETKDKNGNDVSYYRSTADLNTVESSSVISNFLAYASCNGIEIPKPGDDVGQRICEREMESTKVYGTN